MDLFKQRWIVLLCVYSCMTERCLWNEQIFVSELYQLSIVIITTYPKMYIITTNILYLIHFLEDQESRSGAVGFFCLWLKSLMRLQASALDRAAVIWKLDWGELMARSTWLWTGWRDGFLGHLMAVGTPKASNPREEARRTLQWLLWPSLPSNSSGTLLSALKVSHYVQPIK